MIMYDWKKIYYVSKGKSKSIFKILKILSGQRPTGRKHPLWALWMHDYSGTSFLLNPKELIEAEKYASYTEIAEYIGLASFRNYGHYMITGDSSLDILHSPISEKTIRKNKLLTLTDNKIYFKLEE